MTWTDSFGLSTSNSYPLQTFKKIERCFIRKDHKCGKVFGASRSCFIACPSKDDIEPILEIASMKLSKVGIESIIAVKERAYGQDIFCTKICGKIIESKFCIVILDDSIIGSQGIPNPNVYYEYGLMTSLEKHIIPLQKDDLKLAFNIQSYDTIKYNLKNIGTELDRAIKDAIRITESNELLEKKNIFPEKSIIRSFELAGLLLKDEKWFLHKVIDDTNFKGFGHSNMEFYVLLGKIDKEDEMQGHLEDLNVILVRISRFYETLKYQKKELESEESDYKKTFSKEMNSYYQRKARQDLSIQQLSFQQYDIIGDEKTKQEATIIGEYGSEITAKLVKKKKEREEEIFNKCKLISILKYIGFIINHEINEKDRIIFIDKAKELISKYTNFYLVQDRNGEIVFGDVKVNLQSYK